MFLYDDWVLSELTCWLVLQDRDCFLYSTVISSPIQQQQKIKYMVLVALSCILYGLTIGMTWNGKTLCEVKWSNSKEAPEVRLLLLHHGITPSAAPSTSASGVRHVRGDSRVRHRLGTRREDAFFGRRRLNEAKKSDSMVHGATYWSGDLWWRSKSSEIEEDTVKDNPVSETVKSKDEMLDNLTNEGSDLLKSRRRGRWIRN